MMYVHRCIGVALATLGVVFGGLLLSAAPALAGRVSSGSLPEPTLPAAPFDMPWGLGIGPAGEVFVSNLGSSTVDVYSSGGSFEAEFAVEAPLNETYQVAVDDSTEASDPSKGDVYIAVTGGFVLKYSYDSGTKTATKLGKIEGEGLIEPTAVAVNSTGDVYVADFDHAEVEKGYVNEYAPDGTLIEKELITGLTEPEGMAVNAAGDIFIGSGTGLHEYEPDGTCMNSCAAFGGEETHVNGVTVGPEGDVYADPEGTSETSVFTSTGTPVESFATGISAGFGVGVSATGTVYVTNEAGNDVLEFAPEVTGPKQPLTVEVEGHGNVTGGGISCETNGSATDTGTCSSEEPEGSTVLLTATAESESGWKFKEWAAGGACAASTEPTCEVTMSAPEKAKAVFEELVLEEFPLEVEVKGEGEVNGSGITTCTKSGGAGCTANKKETTKVTLTATPVAGWKFHEWTGVTCKGGNTSNTCTFPMPYGAAKVAIEVEETHTQPLTVFVTGEGEVTGGNGIACGTGDTGTCTESLEGKVTLTGKAGPGYVLAGWIGCKKTGTETCEVEMTAAREVTAVFLKEGTQGSAGTNGEKGGPGGKGAAGATYRRKWLHRR